jgi:hypothetical protein
MVIPVTTKPFLDSFNFILLFRESLHFFSSIKEERKFLLRINKKASFGAHTLCFAGSFNLSLHYGNRSFTNKGGI